jgi:hypothetical protein
MPHLQPGTERKAPAEDKMAPVGQAAPTHHDQVEVAFHPDPVDAPPSYAEATQQRVSQQAPVVVYVYQPQPYPVQQFVTQPAGVHQPGVSQPQVVAQPVATSPQVSQQPGRVADNTGATPAVQNNGGSGHSSSGYKSGVVDGMLLSNMGHRYQQQQQQQQQQQVTIINNNGPGGTKVFAQQQSQNNGMNCKCCDGSGCVSCGCVADCCNFIGNCIATLVCLPIKCVKSIIDCCPTWEKVESCCSETSKNIGKVCECCGQIGKCLCATIDCLGDLAKDIGKCLDNRSS